MKLLPREISFLILVPLYLNTFLESEFSTLAGSDTENPGPLCGRQGLINHSGLYEGQEINMLIIYETPTHLSLQALHFTIYTLIHI